MDDVKTAFPASENVPGQRRSREQYATVRESLSGYAWFQDYLELRQVRLRGRKLDWRKAVYVAWASMPASKRRPATQEELATEILGLRSSHTISNWKRKFPELEDLIAEQQAAPLLQARADIYAALADVASRHDHKAYSDRRLALELLGDYKHERALRLGGELDVSQDDEFEAMSDDELEQHIANLQVAQAGTGPSEDGAGETPTE